MKAIISIFVMLSMPVLASTAHSFGPCSGNLTDGAFAGSRCARTEVPLEHTGPTEGLVELAIRKFPASKPEKRRGQVWLIAGGPGEPGASFYPHIEVFHAAFPGFDLVVPDHRGTGASTRLCPVQESLDSDAGYALADAEWGPCIGSLFANPARTQSFTITNAAHDLASLIEQYREPGEVYVYAVSYGTQLALRLLQVAQPELDGVILDGLIPPESASHWDLSHRTAIMDEVGRSLLDESQQQGLQQLLSAEAAIWQEVLEGLDLRQFLGNLLSFPALRARIPDIIDELMVGKSTLLTDTATELAQAVTALTPYPKSQSSLPLVMLISASENNSRRDLTADVVAKEAEDALFVSPLPGLLTLSTAPLYPRDHYFGQLPEQLPRTLIVHGTLDPFTHYQGAVKHAGLLKAVGDVHLATVSTGAHFLAAMAADCFVQLASSFVAGEEVPVLCEAD